MLFSKHLNGISNSKYSTHGTCALSPQYNLTAEWHQSDDTSPHNTYCGEGCHRFDAIPLSNCIVGLTRMYRGTSIKEERIF